VGCEFCATVGVFSERVFGAVSFVAMWAWSGEYFCEIVQGGVKKCRQVHQIIMAHYYNHTGIRRRQASNPAPKAAYNSCEYYMVSVDTQFFCSEICLPGNHQSPLVWTCSNAKPILNAHSGSRFSDCPNWMLSSSSSSHKTALNLNRTEPCQHYLDPVPPWMNGGHSGSYVGVSYQWSPPRPRK
jgi:hypothetical protein